MPQLFLLRPLQTVVRGHGTFYFISNLFAKGENYGHAVFAKKKEALGSCLHSVGSWENQQLPHVDGGIEANGMLCCRVSR